MTLDDFFAGQDDSRQLFETLRRTVDALGPAPVGMRITKSQGAFRLRRV